MPKRTVRKLRGATLSVGVVESVATPAQDALAAIFASIREGQAPATPDHGPADTGATVTLLDELDRIWQRPLRN